MRSQEPKEVNLSMAKFLKTMKARLKLEEAQTMAEYTVVLAVITVATVAVFTALSGGISSALSKVTALL
jgi:Flp pilus assembly pilin Flp